MSDIGDRVIIEARKHIGKRYVWGTAGPNTFDCSGYVSFCLTKVTGRWWSRSSYDYVALGNPVDRVNVAQWQPGDVLCFDTEGNGRAGHVGFFAGVVNNRPVMFNALNENEGVVRSDPLSPYFGPRLLSVRRVVFDPAKPDPKPEPEPVEELTDIKERLSQLESRVTSLERRQGRKEKADSQPRNEIGQFTTQPRYVDWEGDEPPF